MASRDLSPYVDLSLFDRDPEEIVDQALVILQDRLPGLEVRTGLTEVAIIEAVAVQVAELVYAVNRLPGAVTSVLMRLFGSEPSEGVAATTTLTFTLSDTLGHTIPAGTSVRLPLGGELEDLELTTDADLDVTAGNLSGTVAATADRPTDEANGIAAGGQVDLIDPISYVETVVLASDVVGGQGPESDADWLNRAVQRLQRLVTTLVLPEHFTAAALDEVDVARATTVDNYDPSGGGVPGDNPGHETVAVIGPDGALLTAGRKTEIEETLGDLALAILAVHVIDPTLTAVDVTVTVQRLDTHTDVQVTENVTAVLTEYLDPDAWPWSATVHVNELIAIIDGADGVDYVVDVTLPAADVALAGVAPLATIGTVTVTVNAP